MRAYQGGEGPSNATLIINFELILGYVHSFACHVLWGKGIDINSRPYPLETQSSLRHSQGALYRHPPLIRDRGSGCSEPPCKTLGLLL